MAPETVPKRGPFSGPKRGPQKVKPHCGASLFSVPFLDRKTVPFWGPCLRQIYRPIPEIIRVSLAYDVWILASIPYLEHFFV